MKKYLPFAVIKLSLLITVVIWTHLLLAVGPSTIGETISKKEPSALLLLSTGKITPTEYKYLK